MPSGKCDQRAVRQIVIWLLLEYLPVDCIGMRCEIVCGGPLSKCKQSVSVMRRAAGKASFELALRNRISS